MFKMISIPEPNPTLSLFRDRIQDLSSEPLRFHDSPAGNEEEFIHRCAGAEAILTGWTSKIPKTVIESCPDLKYIGLACTLFEGEGSNVDLACARARGITVTGVRDYGDVGVAEFVLSEIVWHFQHRLPRRELAGRKVGVIGAGGAGAPVALALKNIGADVAYFSRSPKPLMEKAGIPKKNLETLLEESEIISIHLPRNTTLIDSGLLNKFRGELILNTSLGLPVEEKALKSWLKGEGHWFTADADGLGPVLGSKEEYPNIRHLPYYSGFTSEAQIRLVDTVAANMKTFLNGTLHD